MSDCFLVRSVVTRVPRPYVFIHVDYHERTNERASKRRDGGVFSAPLTSLRQWRRNFEIVGRATNRYSLSLGRDSFREDDPAACILAHVRENIAIFGLSGVPSRRLTSGQGAAS